MIRNQKPLACLLFALALPLLAQAQSKLILPQNQDDIRRLTERADAGPCVRCGVITNVRSDSRKPTSRRTPAAPPVSGIGNNVATTPVISSGSAVRDARNATKATTFYRITVRYDDDTYAFFEQDDKPDVRKGDKVEIIDNRVVLRAD